MIQANNKAAKKEMFKWNSAKVGYQKLITNDESYTRLINTTTIVIAFGPNYKKKNQKKTNSSKHLQTELDNARGNIILMGNINGIALNNNTGITIFLGPYGEMEKDQKL